MERKKIALVLGGGGALGFCHIGVIKVLEKYKVPIDIIVGTSMGGLVGAAYASGLSVKEMTQFACKFKKIHFIDVNFNASGLFSGKGVMEKINKFLPDKNIQDLKKRFACVACDLYSEKEIIFNSGNVRDAVRATLSMPGFFVPFKKDEMLLVDGGVVNNLPEDVAMDMGPDIIISVDSIAKSFMTKKPRTIIDTLIYSINIMTKVIQNCKACHANISLQPNLSGLTLMGFGKKNALKAIKEGELETEKHIQEILDLIKK